MARSSSYGGAVKAVFFVLCFSMIGASHADEDNYSCQRQDADPEARNTVRGSYEIIGKMPDSGILYRGTLKIEASGVAYTLKRTVKGATMTGEAWIAACGPNKLKSLGFKYTQGRKPLEGHCLMKRGFEIETYLSCYTNFVGVEAERPGLESMFPIYY